MEDFHHQATKNTKFHQGTFNGIVIPAKAGIQRCGPTSTTLDSGLRRNDGDASKRAVCKPTGLLAQFFVNLNLCGLVVKTLLKFERIHHMQ